MTRKDYILIANALNEARWGILDYDNGFSYDEQASHLKTWDMVVRLLSDELYNDNIRFDKDRFRRACEGVK